MRRLRLRAPPAPRRRCYSEATCQQVCARAAAARARRRSAPRGAALAPARPGSPPQICAAPHARRAAGRTRPAAAMRPTRAALRPGTPPAAQCARVAPRRRSGAARAAPRSTACGRRDRRAARSRGPAAPQRAADTVIYMSSSAWPWKITLGGAPLLRRWRAALRAGAAPRVGSRARRCARAGAFDDKPHKSPWATYNKGARRAQRCGDACLRTPCMHPPAAAWAHCDALAPPAPPPRSAHRLLQQARRPCACAPARARRPCACAPVR
jgi:hypothetical protein